MYCTGTARSAVHYMVIETERETEEQQMVGYAMQNPNTHTLAVHCVQKADNSREDWQVVR